MLVELVLRHACQQHAANRKVRPPAIAFGDEGIRRLLNAIVEESVGILQAMDQPGTDGFQERRVDLLFGLSEDHTQRRNLSHVPETGELLESGLPRTGQSP